MYFVMLLAHPKPSHDAYGQVDGAYAACFVDTGSAAEAEHQVRQALDATGWDTEAVEELRVVTREEYAEDPDTLAKFDRASRWITRWARPSTARCGVSVCRSIGSPRLRRPRRC